jgi:hypothetical protein
MNSRRLRLRGAAGKIRTEYFMSQEHLVVPIVALVEGVIWPVNAESPELVLAEELAIAPAGWNGRPVFVNHPADDEANQISGNNPETLELSSFGIIFNADPPGLVLANKKLRYEAWLNKEKAPEVEGAVRIIERLEAEDPDDLVEISVGVFVRAEKVEGEWKGIKYKAIWRNIVPDHHAMLPEGMIGACSVDMGCGAPRIASVHLVTAHGLELIGDEDMTVPKKPDEKDKKTVRERVAEITKFRTNAGEDGTMSDADLRGQLDSQLRAVEPGYWGIDSVFPESQQVVYAVYPEDTFQLFQRSYKIDDNNAVTLKDDREEVTPVTVYTPVTAEANPKQPAQPTAAASCGCRTDGGSMKTMNERIAALIANGRFKEEDKTWLEKVPEARFEALEAAQPNPPKPVEPPAPAPAPAPAPNPPAPAPKPAEESRAAAAVPKTTEEYLATLPAAVAGPIRQGIRAAESRKAATIKALKDSGRCKFDDAALNAKDQDELDMLMDLAGVSTQPQSVDFGAGNAPRAAETKDKGRPPAAPDFFEASRKASAKRAVSE